MSGISIKVSGDVQSAVRGLERVTERLRATGAAGQSFGNSMQRSSQIASSALAKTSTSSNQATLALSNLSRVAQDAPYGFIGIANNINPLLESFQRLKVSTGSTKGALKALGSSLTGAGGLGLAVGIASSLLVVFGDKLFGASKKAEELKKKSDEVKSAIDGIFSSTAKEATEVGSLITVLKSETETRVRKLEAIKELQKIQPEVFNGLKLEGNAVAGLDQAYQNYISNLKNVIAAKILQVELEAKIEKLLKMQGVTASSALEKFANEGGMLKIMAENFAKAYPGERNFYLEQLNATKEQKQKAQAQLEAEIKDLFNQLKQFSNNIKIDIPKVDIKDTVDLIDPLDVTQMLDVFTKRLQEQTKKPVPVEIPVDFKIKEPEPGSFSAKNIGSELQNQLKGLASLVSDTLTPVFDSFFSTIAQGGNAFKAFAQAAAQALTGLITKLLTTAALSLILGPVLGIGVGVGAASSKFADVFKFLSGFGGRAAGGPVAANRPVVVGEAGRELFIPSTSGRIVPNGSLSQFAGQAAQMINVTVNGVISGNNLALVMARQNRYQLSNV